MECIKALLEAGAQANQQDTVSDYRLVRFGALEHAAQLFGDA